MDHIAGQVKAAFGLSNRRLAKIVGCAPASLGRWERGECQMHPLYAKRFRQLWRNYNRSKSPRWTVPVICVKPDMWRYFSPPGSEYRHWSWKKRLSFMAQRARYRRILEEVQAGRARLEYIEQRLPDQPRRSIFEDAILRLARRHGIDLYALAVEPSPPPQTKVSS